MQTQARNLTVGLFVLISMAILGWMIVKFGTQPRALSNTYEIRMNFPTAGSLTDGCDVRVNGIVVGHVRSVSPRQNFYGGVQVIADIERRFDIPRNSQATIQLGGLTLSKAAVDIEVLPGVGREMLAKDGKAVLPGRVVSGMENLIPTKLQDQMAMLSDSLVQVAEDLHQLLSARQLPVAGTAATGPDGAIASSQPEGNFSTVVQRMDMLLARMNELLAVRGDVGQTLANARKLSESALLIAHTIQEFSDRAVVVADSANTTFRTATTQLERIGGDASATMHVANAQLKRIGDDLHGNSAQLAQSLDTLNRALAAIAEGKGTAGKLLNDPALYETMLLAGDRLHKTIIELEQLVKQWRAEGVQIKLK